MATVYINLEGSQQYGSYRDHFWRSGFIDQSHFHFRDSRELLQKYHFSKQFDEVIFLSADLTALDFTLNAKLEFYLDKVAKSAAAKARNQNVAIVTNGTIGLSSRLPALAKTYIAARAVHITTIAVSPYDGIDAGDHNKEVVADGLDIVKAGQGYDLHILVKFKEKFHGANIWGSELDTTYSIITGLVSHVGSIFPLFAKSNETALHEMLLVPRAIKEGIKVNPLLLEGVGGVTDAMIRYFHSEDPNQKYKNDETLKDLENKQLPDSNLLSSLFSMRSIFIVHTLDSSIPDILPTGVTLDKTGRPAWETVMDMKHYN